MTHKLGSRHVVQQVLMFKCISLYLLKFSSQDCNTFLRSFFSNLVPAGFDKIY